MGLGKAIMLQLTQVVKCDWCGNVIMDARYRPTGSSSADRHGGAGPTLFETIKYSSKKHNFCCNMCETAYKTAHGDDEPKKDAKKSKKITAELTGDENVPPHGVAQANFCSHCGGPLKQNARFCSQCGKSIR
jgi:hypothetical protein